MSIQFRVRELLDEFNAQRAAAGLPAVTDAEIAEAADISRASFSRMVANDESMAASFRGILDRLIGELARRLNRPVTIAEILVHHPTSRAKARATPRRRGPGRPPTLRRPGQP
jgi:hypothetical protein